MEMFAPNKPLRDGHPEIEPFDSGHLKVSDLHSVYFEQSGCKNGKPLLFLHGGPGGGTSGSDRRYFDPKVYRIVLMDQRGAGKSTPPAELKDNTTWHLVEDIERLREHLGIDKWVVFGGSWGSTLSLTYAESHPDRVKALILRGIFTLRKSEVQWYYQDGASHIFPDHWDEYLKPIPEAERNDLVAAYHKRLTGDDEEERLRCARHWSRWEMGTSRLHVDPNLMTRSDSDVWALQFARIECHYFINGGFFESESWVLDNVDKIRHIPATIVQGRYDVVCPATTAWQLHKRWPEAEFFLVPDAGHSAREEGIKSMLCHAAQQYSTL
ncbi:hypothetical protein CAPTEDRAFT_158387 [Capitella teleta]|uniref:Proline iminopeptidase n=1 Tax=Capitella teleta TaxID=283909 RepID=R7VIV9_CAPTE|nr:hypothetical protein CAPTEDRAFT_158387 [Capitella teleta]|eukprot:ELU16211.1 hypothetical protein CAPTEDRAFT_158387 [Capitella teleta]